jgi:hypothetical protein
MRVMTAQENAELLRLYGEFEKVEQSLLEIMRSSPQGPQDAATEKRWLELLDELDGATRAFTDTQRAYLRPG